MQDSDETEKQPELQPEFIDRPELPVLWRGAENLVCQLNPEELQERADAMAEREIAVRDLEAKIEALNREKKQLRGQIADHREEIETLSNAIHFRREPRDVQVVAFVDHATDQALVWRPDNGQLVRSRPLTAKEKQQELPFAEAAEE